MPYRYIAIEGNIGAGKTTLATRLAAHYSARLVLEEFADNTFLPKFYAEPDRYAFPLELSFLAARYAQLKAVLGVPDLFEAQIISDYVFTKSKLFARVNLKPDEWELFSKLFDIIDPQLPAPELMIFLQAPVPLLQQHIHQRARSYEQAIPDAYLTSVGDVYAEFLKGVKCPLIIVDSTRVDFLNNEVQWQQLIALLDAGLEKAVYYFT